MYCDCKIFYVSDVSYYCSNWIQFSDRIFKKFIICICKRLLCSKKRLPAFVLISAEIQGQMLLDPLKTKVAVAVVICM